MKSKSYTLEVGGKAMVAEFTDLAEQAQGSVILRYGDTAVLATAVMSRRTREDIDYFPLAVDFEERYYAAGAILGGQYMRREGKQSESAVLSGRIVDRTIRPLFCARMRNEVHVVITVLALGEDDPQHVAVNAASLALATSPIPWGGPVAAVRIGSGLAVNPTYAQRRGTDLDMLACGKDGMISMIEVGSREIGEEEIAAGLARAIEEHGKILEWQEGIIREIGKEKKAIEAPELPAALAALYESEFAPRMEEAVFCGAPSKDAIYALSHEWLGRVGETEEISKMKGVAKRYFEGRVDQEIHRGAVEGNKRADGRDMDEVRPLFAKAGGVSGLLHGSGIFYRGGTHVFSALTLGGPGDAQLMDSMERHGEKQRFMHHYNFPPYSAGEAGRIGPTNRRATGHGKLAEKALEAVLPGAEEFPYTVRLVSECMASNGSTSMASVCASTLALMDGGVPIKAPVAGIAMGLMLGEGYAPGSDSYRVLTDIQGPEDEFGDMDLKVAGTRAGVTAIQMDIKLEGVALPILIEALAGAKAARRRILDTIEREIARPRERISARAPEIVSLKVKPSQIGQVIGGGGKTINGIRESAMADDITIENDGSVFITGRDGSAAKAKAMIEALVRDYKPGEAYEGEVTRLIDIGAFVRIGPGKNAEGLVHADEIAPFQINNISDAVAVGDKVRVMIREIDDKGRLNLSIKMADPEFAIRKGLSPEPHASTDSRPAASEPDA